MCVYIYIYICIYNYSGAGQPEAGLQGAPRPTPHILYAMLHKGRYKGHMLKGHQSIYSSRKIYINGKQINIILPTKWRPPTIITITVINYSDCYSNY